MGWLRVLDVHVPLHTTHHELVLSNDTPMTDLILIPLPMIVDNYTLVIRSVHAFQ